MKGLALAVFANVLAGWSSTAPNYFSVSDRLVAEHCWGVYFEDKSSLVDYVDEKMLACNHYAVLGVGGDVAISMRLRRPDGSEYEISVPSW